jgi:hypothetical protein
VDHGNTLRKHILGRGNMRCKGLPVGIYFISWRNSKETIQAYSPDSKGAEVEDELREKTDSYHSVLCRQQQADSKGYPQYAYLLVIRSIINLGTAVKGLCYLN